MHKYISLRFCVNFGACLLMVMGLTVMFGWYTGSHQLIQLNPKFVPMQFNTSLGFFGVSIALIGLNNQYKKISLYIGIFLSFLGSLTLTQQILGVNFYIDELFMKHYIVIDTSHPGRMAPNTALAFLISGVSLLVMSVKNINLNQYLVGSVLGALTMGLGSVAFWGYLSHVETAYGWGKLTKMALHTSAGFMVTGLMLMLEARYLSLQIKQKLPILFLPLSLIVLGFTITICLWQALYSSQLYVMTRYGITTSNFVAEGILIFGGIFSIVIAIAVWLAARSYEQLQALRLAQAEILDLNQQLETLSYLDSLTEIPNRRAFNIAIDRELGRAYRHKHSLALIMFDVDYFKSYNDHYGHLAGDQCLQMVAHTINNMAKRKTDMAARYGGEEFVLLLPEANLTDAEKIVGITLKAIADLKIPHAYSQASPYVTVSAGICACIPQYETTVNDLIQIADQGLYVAKSRGRACFVAISN